MEKYFVSEASVYRILKSYDLIASPAYVVLSGLIFPNSLHMRARPSVLTGIFLRANGGSIKRWPRVVALKALSLKLKLHRARSSCFSARLEKSVPDWGQQRDGFIGRLF